MSLRFSFVIPVVERFSSELRSAIKIYWAEFHLESCQHPPCSSPTKTTNGLKTLTVSTHTHIHTHARARAHTHTHTHTHAHTHQNTTADFQLDFENAFD